MKTQTENLVTGKMETCWRCSGAGRIDAFSHIANGACFSCDGSGNMKPGQVENHKNLRVATFVVDGIVWQFEGIRHGEDCHTVAKKGERVDSVMFQAFAVKSHRRRGVTILRARVSPEIGTKVFHAAKDGMKPEEMGNSFLGGFVNGCGEPIGEWSTNSCAIRRNSKGIDLLLM